MTDSDLTDAAAPTEGVSLEATIEALKKSISEEKAFMNYLEAFGQFCWATYVSANVHAQEKALKELETKRKEVALVIASR
jgi:hypothetical protein